MIRKTTIRTIATATTINNIIPTSDPTTTGSIEASETKVYRERMNANLKIICTCNMLKLSGIEKSFN